MMTKKNCREANESQKCNSRAHSVGGNAGRSSATTWSGGRARIIQIGWTRSDAWHITESFELRRPECSACLHHSFGHHRVSVGIRTRWTQSRVGGVVYVVGGLDSLFREKGGLVIYGCVGCVWVFKGGMTLAQCG